MLKKIFLGSALFFAGAMSFAQGTHKNYGTFSEADEQQQLHTSEYWYQHAQPDDYWFDKQLTNADGWRGLKNPPLYWFSQEITYGEFLQRFIRSSMWQMNEGELGERFSPFKA